MALSEIRSMEMCARKCGCGCVCGHCACVEECVYLQCYYSFLTEFTLSSKSAGGCNKGVYLSVWRGGRKTLCSLYYADSVCIILLLCVRMSVCPCVFYCGLLDLLSTSLLVLLLSLPSACFTLLLSAHTHAHKVHKSHTTTQKDSVSP